MTDQLQQEMLIPPLQKRVFSSTMMNTIHHIYLSGPLTEPQDYVEEFEIIRNMGDSDTAYLHINGPGGCADTATQFIRCIEDTRGTVIASNEGTCASAYTFIFLKAHGWEVSEHSIFMAHNYSSFMGGKGNELWERAQHDKKWFDNYAKDIYKNFLSDEEISKVIDGKDIYLTPDEVLDRCQTKLGNQKEEMSQNLPEGTILIDDMVIDEQVYHTIIDHWEEKQSDQELGLEVYPHEKLLSVIGIRGAELSIYTDDWDLCVDGQAIVSCTGDGEVCWTNPVYWEPSTTEVVTPIDIYDSLCTEEIMEHLTEDQWKEKAEKVLKQRVEEVRKQHEETTKPVQED